MSLNDEKSTTPGCSAPNNLVHILPKEENAAEKRTDLISGALPRPVANQPLQLCTVYLTPQDIHNQGLYNAGVVPQLILGNGSIPMIQASSPSTGTGTSSGVRHCSPAVRHVGSQTDPTEKKSVGTQLSVKTLQNRFRSKATQARVPGKDCGVGTLTFPLSSPILFLQPTIVKRPSKWPRLSLTDEEEGPSDCSQSMVVNEPEDST